MISPPDAEVDPQPEDENQAKEELQKARKEIAKLRRLIERYQVEEGSAWLLRAEAAEKEGDHFNALMLAGRALGYQGYGREDLDDADFNQAFPLLLAEEMEGAAAEQARVEEFEEVTFFINYRVTEFLPMWAGALSAFAKSAAFSPDGTHLLCGCQDGTLKLWDTSTGTVLAHFKTHGAPVFCVAFSPDGSRFASGSLDGSTHVWDTATQKKLITLNGRSKAVNDIAFSPDGTRLACCTEMGPIKVWDSITGEEVAVYEPHPYRTTKVIYRPDGTRQASGIWNDDPTPQSSYSRPTCVAFSPDGSRLVSGHWDGTIKIWDTATGRELHPFCGHSESVNCVAFSPDGSILVSGSGDAGRGKDPTVRLWDVATGEELTCFKGDSECVQSVNFSPDGAMIASSGSFCVIKLWDVASKQEILFQRDTDASEILFSPDGSRLATPDGTNGIKLWDVDFLRRRGRHAIFSPDGSRLAGADDKTIRIWDAATGIELAELPTSCGEVFHLIFSPDSKQLEATCSSWEGAVFTCTLNVWDTLTGAEISVTPTDRSALQQRAKTRHQEKSPDQQSCATFVGKNIYIYPQSETPLNLAARLRVGLVSMHGRKVVKHPKIERETPMLHRRQDTLTQLADATLTAERRAELRMELCAKSGQFRAATALWHQLSQGMWPGFEGRALPSDQPPTHISADSRIRHHYLLALIHATRHPQIHGKPCLIQTASQITLALTKEMMDMPTISLAMMSLMKTLTKDDDADMITLCAALMKRLEEVAPEQWLMKLREAN